MSLIRNHIMTENSLVKILKSMYEGTFSAVRSGGCLSDWFETTVGVMQGCVFSPLLFNVFWRRS